MKQFDRILVPGGDFYQATLEQQQDLIRLRGEAAGDVAAEQGVPEVICTGGTILHEEGSRRITEADIATEGVLTVFKAPDRVTTRRRGRTLLSSLVQAMDDIAPGAELGIAVQPELADVARKFALHLFPRNPVDVIAAESMPGKRLMLPKLLYARQYLALREAEPGDRLHIQQIAAKTDDRVGKRKEFHAGMIQDRNTSLASARQFRTSVARQESMATWEAQSDTFESAEFDD